MLQINEIESLINELSFFAGEYFLTKRKSFTRKQLKNDAN
jgi:hypothetical protein